MNEIVKYDNYMNQLSFKNFEQKDFDLLMALCSRLRDLGEETQVFSYDYLMDLVDWDKTQSITFFHKTLRGMCEKLRQVGATLDVSPNKFKSFNLFMEFDGDLDARTLTCSVNPKFKFILNELSGSFTRFELKEYANLEGRYAKQLYSQIKQRYHMSGHFWQPTVDELRHALSIPPSYKVKEITAKIVDPAVLTLRSCKGLKELEVNIIKAPRRGAPVIGYRFSWTAPSQVPGQMSLEDLAPEKTKKKRGRPPKNAFTDIEQNEYDFEALEKALLEKP